MRLLEYFRRISRHNVYAKRTPYHVVDIRPFITRAAPSPIVLTTSATIAFAIHHLAGAPDREFDQGDRCFIAVQRQRCARQLMCNRDPF